MSMSEILKSIKEDFSAIKAKIDTIDLTDGSVPLDDRWEIFVSLSNMGLLPNNNEHDGFADIFDDNCEAWSITKFETSSYSDLYDTTIFYKTENGSYTQEQADEWREAVLADGFGSFTYDW